MYGRYGWGKHTEGHARSGACMVDMDRVCILRGMLGGGHVW